MKLPGRGHPMGITPTKQRFRVLGGETITTCPYKSDASYFPVTADGRTFENAVWSCQTSYPTMAQIAGCIARYPGQVNIELSP